MTAPAFQIISDILNDKLLGALYWQKEVETISENIVVWEPIEYSVSGPFCILPNLHIDRKGDDITYGNDCWDIIIDEYGDDYIDGKGEKDLIIAI